MDAKDLRVETAQSEHNDGSKYSQGRVVFQCNRNKPYQDIGSNSLGKTESATVRPCAVIGPDRVVPPPVSNDAYLKKVSVEPWPSPDNVYRRPPDYPHKGLNSLNPSRNISPRQTFQENMQRIMVPPSYNALKHNEDSSFNQNQDRSASVSKNNKPNMAHEAKFCDVPYIINPVANEPKLSKESDMCVSGVNSPLARGAPHGWPPPNVNLQPPRNYGPEMYQYPQYPKNVGPRSIIPMSRPHRIIQEESGYVYSEPYYQDGNIPFKSYPSVKERYPQARYEYFGSYSNPFHLQPIQTHKYDIPKSNQHHPYPIYPHLKYLDNRLPDPSIEGYQRQLNQQPHYNVQYHNQLVSPGYAPVTGNPTHNKVNFYPLDGSTKSLPSNKLSYENSGKIYIDYENNRAKAYPMADNYFVNEMNRNTQAVKNQMIMANYQHVGMHTMPTQQFYRKENLPMKPLDYMSHLRNFESALSNPMMRQQSQFSPNTIPVSPTESNISNDTLHTQVTLQEDCGYASQSSSASVRSIDSGVYRPNNDYYKRFDYRYGPVGGNLHPCLKTELNSNKYVNIKEKKDIDVRQFLQMWNEGEEENSENTNSKEIIVQTNSSNGNKINLKQNSNNQEQLYVLGLVNVPSDELNKYEHIQKVSKLPENIKGYSNIELLNQFEEAIESSSNCLVPGSKDYQLSSKDNSSKQIVESLLPRPVSPLDVEAKISQSVIHKDVGCNFEIKPCSPKMLNVEIAAPAPNILDERVIEKVTNPHSKITKSPLPVNQQEQTSNYNKNLRQENSFATKDNHSCKMVGSPYATTNLNPVKTNYCLQELEINAGVCLASLPRLDNEIELNFPEVNQQFINANKKEEGHQQTHDISKKTEELNMPNSKLHDTETERKETQENIANITLARDPEKTISKLSKYRKLKFNTTDYSDNISLSNVIRTDSVIIKNPENIKNIEDNLLESNTPVPINLKPQETTDNDSAAALSNQVCCDIDMALDFSLNKTDNGFSVINLNKDEQPCTDEILQDSILKDNDYVVRSPSKENDGDTCLKSADDSENEIKNFNNIFENVITDSIIATAVPTKNISTDCNTEKSCHSIEKKCLVTKENFTIDELTSCYQDNRVFSNQDDLSCHVQNSESKIVNLQHSTPHKIQENRKDSLNIECVVHPSNEIIDIVKDEKNIETGDLNKTTCKTIHENTGNNENVLQYNEVNQTHVVLVSRINSVRKGLCSPWIQKLIIFEEGLCIRSNENMKITFDSAKDTEQIYQTEPSMAGAETESHCEGVVNYNHTNNLAKNNAEVDISDEHYEKDSSNIKDAFSRKDNSRYDKIHMSINDWEQIEQINEENLFVERALSIQMEEISHIPESNASENSINISIKEQDFNKIVTDKECQMNDDQDKIKKNDLPELLLSTTQNVIKDKDFEKLTTYLPENISKVPIPDNNTDLKSIEPLLNKVELNQATFNSTLPKQEFLQESQISDSLVHSTELTKSDQGKDFISKNESINPNCDGLLGDELNGKQKLTFENLDIISKHEIKSDNFLNTPHDVTLETESHSNKITDFVSRDIMDNSLGKKDIILQQVNANVGNNIRVEKYTPEFYLENLEPKKKEDIKNDFFNYITSTENSFLDEQRSLEKSDKEIVEKRVIHADCVGHKINKNIDNVATKILKDSDDIFDINKITDSTIKLPQCSSNIDVTVHSDGIEEKLPKCLNESVMNQSNSQNDINSKPSLKRSFSDSHLNTYKNRNDIKRHNESCPFVWSSKRKKSEELKYDDQSNRRNSISSFYNEENVSFCILIDNNCIIAEENEDEICFAELPEDCINSIDAKHTEASPGFSAEVVTYAQDNDLQFSDIGILNYNDERSFQETWIDDVACVETVGSDDVTEDVVIGISTSPNVSDDEEYDESGIFSCEINDQTDEAKYMCEENILEENSQILESLCRTPNKSPNNSFTNEAAIASELSNDLYGNESLENMLSESFSTVSSVSPTPMHIASALDETANLNHPEDKENIFQDCTIKIKNDDKLLGETMANSRNYYKKDIQPQDSTCFDKRGELVESCESTVDNVMNYKEIDKDQNYISSSPEVSSTTSEEKGTSILLKITNYNGSRVSEINEVKSNNNNNKPRCKFTEVKDYSHSTGNFPHRPLLTKAAQKYIPPLKETVHDLKIKLALPQQRLLKLKQLKILKKETVVPKQNNSKSVIPKKIKPNFEDVLKSIDDIQIKKHKEKSKKLKNSVPKVVIKKNQNGSHYTSSTSKDSFNPDLTGRKWQPWVFLEKNNFIDKMVLKNKTKAIFNRRKNTYVLAEKFKKYKSVRSTNFFISHQSKCSASSKGQLKCTIRLKHTY